jgi:hypothetical protein
MARLTDFHRQPPTRALVDAFLVDSWLLVIGLRMLLRRNPRRFSQRLKLRRIRKKCSQNLRWNKI